MDQRGPLSPFVLGWAGVIPFAVLSAATCLRFAVSPAPVTLLVGYGVAILSFMAGAQWGLAMRAPDGSEHGWRGYAISVVPALIGWICLFLPVRPALLVLAASFAALLAYDLWTLRLGYAPPWYGRLRWQLTSAVLALLIVAAAFAG